METHSDPIFILSLFLYSEEMGNNSFLTSKEKITMTSRGVQTRQEIDVQCEKLTHAWLSFWSESTYPFLWQAYEKT